MRNRYARNAAANAAGVAADADGGSMTVDDATARRRYFMIVGARLAGVAGALLGLVLLGRATALPPRLLGIAIVLSALAMIAIVPRALAQRWRTPPEP